MAQNGIGYHLVNVTRVVSFHRKTSNSYRRQQIFEALTMFQILMQ